MTTIQSLISGYREASKRLHEEETKLRWNYGEDLRKLICVRAVHTPRRVPFTVCPGEKRVRISVDEICEDYVVCDKANKNPLSDWSITLT